MPTRQARAPVRASPLTCCSRAANQRAHGIRLICSANAVGVRSEAAHHVDTSAGQTARAAEDASVERFRGAATRAGGSGGRSWSGAGGCVCLLSASAALVSAMLLRSVADRVRACACVFAGFEGGGCTERDEDLTAGTTRGGREEATRRTCDERTSQRPAGRHAGERRARHRSARLVSLPCARRVGRCCALAARADAGTSGEGTVAHGHTAQGTASAHSGKESEPHTPDANDRQRLQSTCCRSDPAGSH